MQDLAARNILVGDNETCKVADFGLLREIPKDDSIYQMHTNVPCPVRWMPPESISQRKFSMASDVWSFGVLQWEMFNPKKMPYGSFGNMEVAMKVSCSVCASYDIVSQCVISSNQGVYIWALMTLCVTYTRWMIVNVFPNKKNDFQFGQYLQSRSNTKDSKFNRRLYH